MSRTTQRSFRPSHRGFAGAALGLWVLVASAWPAAGSELLEPAVFEFQKINRTYTELTTDVVPIQQGAVTINLSSPRHRLDILSNRLMLRPNRDGSHGLALTLEFSGEGWLIADIDASGAQTRFEDELKVPRQKSLLLARVRIEAGDEGYLVTTEDLPESFELTIESQLANQLVTLCQQLSAIPILSLNCDGIAESLTELKVPMPDVGETYVIEYSRMTPGEKRQLDDYLARTAPLRAAG